MATNNFLQFNPGAANQQSDGTYAADATRSGGITFNQIMSSLLGNKLFFQLSTFVAAFAQMMADKGYSMSDANFNTLKGQLANVLTKSEVPRAIRSGSTVNSGNTTLNTIYNLVYGLALSTTAVARMRFLFTVITQGAGTTNVVLKLNGSTIVTVPITSGGASQYSLECFLVNSGSTSSDYVTAVVLKDNGLQPYVVTVRHIDTSAGLTAALTVQSANSGDDQFFTLGLMEILP